MIVTNSTVSAELGCKINLAEFSSQTWNIEYKPKKFNAAFLRFRSPKATCLLFSNGKINCLGTKKFSDAKKAIRKCARKLQKFGYLPSIKNLKLSNIAAYHNLEIKLDLDKLDECLGLSSSYEPELFCGLIYTFGASCKATVHNSGKINLTGSVHEKELRRNLNVLLEKIIDFLLLP